MLSRKLLKIQIESDLAVLKEDVEAGYYKGIEGLKMYEKEWRRIFEKMKSLLKTPTFPEIEKVVDKWDYRKDYMEEIEENKIGL
jgi:hypothetical protein